MNEKILKGNRDALKLFAEAAFTKDDVIEFRRHEIVEFCNGTNIYKIKMPITVEPLINYSG